MAEVKLRSKHQDSLKKIIQDALAEKLRGIEEGLQKNQSKIKNFENKYQMKTSEFLNKFNHNEFDHNLEFDEWIGEAWMLDKLYQDKAEIEEIEFVD